MRERLASFGDVVFGLLLGGVVAMYAAMLHEQLGHPHAVTALNIASAQMLAVVEFLVISALWALQAHVITRLYFEHVGFVAAYITMLYFLFGWILVLGAIPELLHAASLTAILPVTAQSPTLLITAASFILLLMAIAGLAYNWAGYSPLQIYESARTCAMIVAVCAFGAFAASHPLNITQPFDIIVAFSLLLMPRLIFAAFVDGVVVEKWGSADDKKHLRRVKFSGSVVFGVYLLVSEILLMVHPLPGRNIFIYVYGVILVFLAVSIIRQAKAVSEKRASSFAAAENT